MTARNRNVQGDYNCPVSIAGLLVNPGDIIIADVNGIVVIPADKAKKVLEVCEDMEEKEQKIIARLKAGISFRDVDKESGYDTMLDGE